MSQRLYQSVLAPESLRRRLQPMTYLPELDITLPGSSSTHTSKHGEEPECTGTT